jgi:hypothetical protein
VGRYPEETVMYTSCALIRASLFTAADRCDRCGDRASLLAALHSGGQLQFCGQHARIHRSALERIADLFEDQPSRAECWAARPAAVDQWKWRPA